MPTFGVSAGLSAGGRRSAKSQGLGVSGLGATYLWPAFGATLANFNFTRTSANPTPANSAPFGNGYFALETCPMTQRTVAGHVQECGQTPNGLGHQSFDRCCGHTPGWLGGSSSTTTGFLVVASPLRLVGSRPLRLEGRQVGRGGGPTQGDRLCSSFQREVRCKEDGTSARRVRWTCPYVVLKGDTAKLRGRGHKVNQGVGIFSLCRSQNMRQCSTAFTTFRTFLHVFWPSTGWSTATKGIGKDTHSCNSRSLVSRLLCVLFVAHHELCDDAPLQLPEPFGNGDCRTWEM